jgi:hypothetical protein
MPRPHFTGRWVLNLQRSELQIPPPESSLFVIEHDESFFRLTRTHVYNGESNTISFELTTDGKEYDQDFGELHASSRLYWDDDRLVLDMKVRINDDEGTNIAWYSLGDSGCIFIAVEQWRSAKHSHDNRWVYDRVS